MSVFIIPGCTATTITPSGTQLATALVSPSTPNFDVQYGANCMNKVLHFNQFQQHYLKNNAVDLMHVWQGTRSNFYQCQENETLIIIEIFIFLLSSKVLVCMPLTYRRRKEQRCYNLHLHRPHGPIQKKNLLWFLASWEEENALLHWRFLWHWCL